MPISRSKPPATYVPYNYLTARGGTVASSIKLTDASGNAVDLSATDTILYMQYQELKAIRMMMTHITGSKITDKDVINF